MELTSILSTLKALGLSSQTLLGVGIGYAIYRLHAIERRVAAVASVINGCPTCRRHAPVAPFVMGLACLGLGGGCHPNTVEVIRPAIDLLGAVALVGFLVAGVSVFVLMLRPPRGRTSTVEHPRSTQ